jgi:hypothetical protein
MKVEASIPRGGSDLPISEEKRFGWVISEKLKWLLSERRDTALEKRERRMPI